MIEQTTFTLRPKARGFHLVTDEITRNLPPLPKVGLLNLFIQLKKLSELLSMQQPLTTYTARHSWASVAKSKNIPLSVISEGMGHDSEVTTQIYLASLDTAVVDKANRMILRLLG